MPSSDKVKVDMDHFSSGHMKGCSRVSPNNDLFPDDWSQTQVEMAVRGAYRSAERLHAQGERVLVRGVWNEMTIEMWVDKTTKIIETAYPVRS